MRRLSQEGHRLTRFTFDYTLVEALVIIQYAAKCNCDRTRYFVTSLPPQRVLTFWVGCEEEDSVFANGSLLDVEMKNGKQTVCGCFSFVFNAVIESFQEY